MDGCPETAKLLQINAGIGGEGWRPGLLLERQRPILSSLTVNNEARLMTGDPTPPSILGDRVYPECLLLVRAAKQRGLQKVLCLFEVELFSLCMYSHSNNENFLAH